MLGNFTLPALTQGSRRKMGNEKSNEKFKAYSGGRRMFPGISLTALRNWFDELRFRRSVERHNCANCQDREACAKEPSRECLARYERAEDAEQGQDKGAARHDEWSAPR